MPALPAEKSVRGRTPVSKPLNGPSASKPRSGVSSSNKPPPRTPSASSTVSSKSTASGNAKAAGKAPARTPSRGSDSEQPIKVTKLSSTTISLSSSSWAPPAPPSKGPAPAEPTPSEPARTSDPLQVAAQVYPWTYMSSTLDACFKGAEATANNDLEARTKELSAEESEISDERDRLEAERAIQFYDELGSDVFAKAAPAIMQLFHSHGDSCAKLETEALKLAARGTPDPKDEEPLRPYNKMLDELEELQTQATDLQNSITKLTEDPPTKSAATTDAASAPSEPQPDTAATEASAHTQVISVFAACLPVLRARIANLSMAQELLDMALENVSLGLKMESMGLTD